MAESDPSKMSRKEFLAYHAGLEKKAKQQTRDFMDDLRLQQAREEDASIAAQFDDFLNNKYGVSLEDLRREYTDKSDDDEFNKRMKAIGRLVRKGQLGKARAMANHRSVKAGAKRARASKGWCSIMLLILALGAAGVAYGLYEGVALVASAVLP